MKRIFSIILLTVLLGKGYEVNAQAFGTGVRTVSLDLGGANMFHIPASYAPYYNSFYMPLTGELSVQAEFAVQKYLGLGFDVGIGGRANSYVANGRVYTGYYSEFNIPVGLIFNFHFYQLIADHSKRNIHGDKLDIFAGLNIGSGFALHPGYYDVNGNPVLATDILFFAGPQLGVRYFFTPRFGLNAEVGWGKSFINAGFTFRMGGHRKE